MDGKTPLSEDECQEAREDDMEEEEEDPVDGFLSKKSNVLTNPLEIRHVCGSVKSRIQKQL